MRFPSYGQYSLDKSGNMLEVYATGAWTMPTTRAFVEELTLLATSFDSQPWAALLDGRRWVLTTPECQKVLADAIVMCIENGLQRSGYVLDSGMVKRAQIERTHPNLHDHSLYPHYTRHYFDGYFAALKWLKAEGYSP